MQEKEKGKEVLFAFPNNPLCPLEPMNKI